MPNTNIKSFQIQILTHSKYKCPKKKISPTPQQINIPETTTVNPKATYGIHDVRPHILVKLGIYYGQGRI